MAFRSLGTILADLMSDAEKLRAPADISVGAKIGDGSSSGREGDETPEPLPSNALSRGGASERKGMKKAGKRRSGEAPGQLTGKQVKRGKPTQTSVDRITLQPSPAPKGRPVLRVINGKGMDSACPTRSPASALSIPLRLVIGGRH